MILNIVLGGVIIFLVYRLHENKVDIEKLEDKLYDAQTKRTDENCDKKAINKYHDFVPDHTHHIE